VGWAQPRTAARHRRGRERRRLRGQSAAARLVASQLRRRPEAPSPPGTMRGSGGGGPQIRAGRYGSCASAVARVGRITPGRDDGTRCWMLRGSSEISRGCAIKWRLAAREEWRPNGRGRLAAREGWRPEMAGAGKEVMIRPVTLVLASE
jgi:hypothetical protein